MSNFRHHHPKSFGGRGTELPNSWMTEEELVTMRRQNSQYHSVIQNIPSMHSPLLTQNSLLSTPNKSFVNQSSCKMPNSNFTRSPSLDIFKPSHIVNESNYQNRFVGNRFPNSYSHLNVQHKINEGATFKDFTSSNMPPQSHKNDGFPESIPKPLFSNVRQSQERLSCMQNDQTQFHSKYDNSRVYQEKGFPYSSDKDFQSRNQAPINDHTSVGSNFSYKSNYRNSSLFPAYTPKDMHDESTKALQHSGYNSNFIGKSNTFCDKTPISSSFVGKSNNLCDKSPAPSATYSKTMEPYHGKAEPFQERAEPFQEKAEPFQQRNASERVVNELFPPHNTTTSFMYDKQSLKTMCNSQVPHDSFKTLEDSVTVTGSKYSYPPESRQACFQSPTEIAIQRSQNLQMPNHSSTTSSKDYYMQSVPFSSQSDIQQNVKENFSTFNFESNINTTDIADLLPGLDAFLKEHLEKPEVPKNDMSKSSNCAFSDDEWSKHSIPFIGDNQASSDNVQNNKDSYCDHSIYMKEKCSDKFELKSERVTESQARNANQANNGGGVGETVPKCPSESEASKVRSALEEAIELLVTNDAIVGLDYIIEYKKNIVQEGRIPFHCKLCNSAITRPSIIDHILGSKHRMRYLKAKDESKYEYIVSLKVEKSEKDAKISEAAFKMEKMYGRGHVTVDTVGYQKDFSVDNSSKEMKEGTADPVFTLDKIPIGFEALSPQHEEMHTEFSLESNLNHANQDIMLGKKESTTIPTSTEVKKNAPYSIPSNSSFTLPGLGGGDSPFYNDKSDSNSMLPQTNCDNEEPNICNVSKESGIKLLKQYSDNTVSCPVKRSLSPEPTIHAKLQKTDISEESESSTDMLTDKKQPGVTTEDSTSEIKEFNLDILEKLSKSTISSEEEASVVLQVINMLMELLLRYKLQHLCLEKVEKLMKSLQTISPENIEDLSSLLKDCNIVESKNVETSTSVLKDTTDNVQQKSSIPLEDNSGRQVRKELSSHTESSNSNVGELDVSVKNVSDNCASGPVLNTKASQPITDVRVNNVSFPASQHSDLENLDSAAEVSKNVTDASCMYQASNSQASSSVGLKPPPFFSWSQTNESLTNQVSYATVQGSQSVVWTSPYQHTQAEYAQLPYYQPQNYSNTYNGTQTYQSQYSALPQNSVPGKMAHPPPLPPPPPPPPPAPSDPPLPPSPSSEVYPSVSTHSVSVPSNTSAHVSLYSKQPLLPSPLP